MHEMDKADEYTLKNQGLDQSSDYNCFITLQTNDFFNGLDSKENKLSENLFEDFYSLSEFFGEEEICLLEEFKKAENLLDERFSIKNAQLPNVFFLMKYFSRIKFYSFLLYIKNIGLRNLLYISFKKFSNYNNNNCIYPLY